MYKTGRIKTVAIPGELGEIHLDGDGGRIVPYGYDDINETVLSQLKKRKNNYKEEDSVSFRISKEGFAYDIQGNSIRSLRRPKGHSI